MSRLQTLPRPHQDELLYSVVARAAIRGGYWSPKELTEIVYGRSGALAVPDMPSNLALIAAHARTCWQLEPDELLVRHTLVGYYTHYAGSVRRQQAISGMLSKGHSLQARLGVCAGSAVAPTRFQLCPACVEQDLSQFGETYWHRSHHLPGVLVCPVHGTPLLVTDIPFRPIGRHQHVAVPLDPVLAGYRPIVDQPEHPEVAHTVAARSAELLDAPAREPLGLPDYRQALSLCGFDAGRGGFEELRSAFAGHFGADLLQASLKAGQAADPLAWLAEALRGLHRPLHPYRHVLMSVFIDARLGKLSTPSTGVAEPPPNTKAWCLYRSPSLRTEATSLAQCGLTTNAVADVLAVDWKTAARLLDPLPPRPQRPCHDPAGDRSTWTSLADDHPRVGKKQLRAMAPALYARMYRNDKEWIVAWRRETQAPSKPRLRVDWEARDTEVAELVSAQVQRVLAELPPRRASRSHVLGRLGLRALVAHRAARLPRTVIALGALCESVAAFQLRRLQAVLSEAAGGPLPGWHVLRLAGINSRRLHDGGLALIAQAQSRLKEARHVG